MKNDEKKRLAEELARCSDALMKIAASLENEKESPAQETKAEAAPLEEKRALALEDVRAILARKSREGFTAEVRELLKKHGASRLSEVKPEEYGGLLKEAEVLGHAG